MTARWLALNAAATLALGTAAAAFPGTAGARPTTRIAGVIADLPTGAHLHNAPRARIANLGWGGGPVLHSNRTHLIFWQPSGSGMTFEPRYESLIERFLTDVAADSRKPTNVYGLSGQYTDSGGPAAYNSTYGGAVVASDPLPANGCTEPLGSGPGWPRCLSDKQMQDEILHAISADRLPTTPTDVYFLVTPSGLGSCEFAGTDRCALGGTASGSYCGYHTYTPDGLPYAVIPYNAVPGHCQSGNPRPNASTADPTISTISHEHNEMVTDPLDNGWTDGAQEDGDLCITAFGRAVGGTGATAWNEVVHGDHYFLQEEWSNEDGSCQPQDESDRISFTTPAHPEAHTRGTFTAHATDPDGSIVSYNWFFGDRGTGHSRRSSHAFKHTGSYRVVLRTTDRGGNWTFYARTIRVGKAAPASGQSKRRRR